MMTPILSLFAGFGVELEYMIVNRNDLSVFPISDKLIHEIAGSYLNEIAFEEIAWSNELVLHVIELKTNGPAKTLTPLPKYFQDHVNKINQMLVKHNAQLLPTGAHPWMNPFTEAKLWPHDYNVIYDTYHRIFNCQGHGWSNLQSAHLNLPFANDEEFAKLHTAIRLLLPIIPALSASTPIVDGKVTGFVDTRLEFYQTNQKKLPTITGKVIPEVVFTKKEYEEKILQKMYDEIASYDPDKILQEEWLNSRGAIARFDRNTIEIRILDIQECPQVDLAIQALIVTVLKAIISEKWQSFDQQQHWPEEQLYQIFQAIIQTGSNTIIHDQDYMQVFHFKGGRTAKELWSHIINELQQETELQPWLSLLRFILAKGNLAERIINSLEKNYSRQNIDHVYHHLANCLQTGRLFSR